ncbi:hypothetical protein [Methylobacterium oxalidis]|uniref:hypothetical protein n=1 Tax=Methylobacterium oxalidis TaxID=944322 RepID=UPI003314F1FC
MRGHGSLWTLLRGSAALCARIVAAYCAGFLILVPFTGIFAPFIIIFAIYLSWPLLIAALCIGVAFQRSLHAHLLAWCRVAPFVVALSYLLLDYGGVLERRGISLTEHILNRATLERTALALVCSTVAAWVFFRIESKHQVACEDETHL